MPDYFTVDEGESAKYTATLEDQNGSAVPSAGLLTLTLTLYDVAAGTVINSRNAQNVLNQNNVTVDSAGLLTWNVQPLDNTVLDEAKPVERHRAMFVYTYASGTGVHEFEIRVANKAKL